MYILMYVYPTYVKFWVYYDAWGIIGEYKRFEHLENYHAPEFNSNASEFHVTM